MFGSIEYDEKVWWYLSRSSGIVALVLLIATQLWGVALATRIIRVERPAWLLDLHKWLGGLALTMTTFHVAGLMLDGYVHFGWSDVLVPGAASYRPFAVSVGILSMYFIVAIQLTSYLRSRLPRGLWQAIHATSYGIVWTTGAHAWLAGTDTSREWYRTILIVLAVLTVFGMIARLRTPTRRSVASAGSGQAV